jgi:hypothetical protein
MEGPASSGGLKSRLTRLNLHEHDDDDDDDDDDIDTVTTWIIVRENAYVKATRLNKIITNTECFMTRFN